MKPLIPIITLLLSIILSLGALSSGGRPQQSPKPGERTGGSQPAGRRQTPTVPAASAEKNPSKDRKQPAGEERAKATGATLKEETKPNLTELEQKGIDLAEQVGEEAKDLDDRRNSAILQAVAADLVWPYRNELARELFQRSFETAVTHYQETQDDNLKQISKNISSSRRDVRVEIIKLVNKRDPKMGIEYNEKYVEAKRREDQERTARGTESTRRHEGGAGRFFGSNVAAADGLIETADTLLREDIKMAVDIALRGVGLGLSPKVPGFLSALAERNRATADGLYLYALEGLRSDAAPLPAHLLALGGYPFGEGEVKISDGPNSSSWAFGKPSNFIIDPRFVERFLTVSLGVLVRLADTPITQSPDGASRLGAAFYAAKVLEPKVAEFHPALQDQWQAVTSRLATLNAGGWGPRIIKEIEREAEQRDPRLRNELRQEKEPNQQARVETLVERAQMTNDFAQRDHLYSQAALNASNAGDVSRAQEIASRISDLTFRGKVYSWINFEAAQKAVGQRRFDEARKYARGVDETDHRAYLFFELAEKALGDNDRARAIELLEEAARRTIDADETQEKVKALLGVANLFLKIDRDRAFGLAEAAVRAANKVQADKLKLGEEDSQMVRTLSYPGTTLSTTTEVTGFDTRKVFGRLAGHDFDRALALAQALENKSVRCRAMIAVAESTLVKR